MKKFINIIKFANKKYLFVISVLLNIIIVGCTIFLPILFGNAINEIINNGTNFKALFQILNYCFILILIITLAQFLVGIINNEISYNLIKVLRIKLFKKIQILPLKYIDKTGNGSILSTIINDVELIGDGVLLVLNQFINGILTIIGTICFMFYINWFIGIFIVVFTPLSIFIARFITKKTYHYFSKVAETRSIISSNIDEYTDNIKIIKRENYGEKALNKFNNLNNQFSDYSFKAVYYSSWTNPFTRFINSIVYAVTALIGAIFIVKGSIGQQITIGYLISLLSYANQYAKPFNDITQVISEIQNAFASSNRIDELFNEKEEDYSKNINEIKNIEGKVDINHVYFSYNTSPLIEDLNLHVDKSMVIAIVGATGAGKTTIINLLMRFYDVNKGNIYLDNFDINTLTKGSFRSQIGMILQDSWLKHASIKENVSIGKKDASMDEIIDACKKAYIHDTIMNLENGYDTIINDDSVLSQGEKQLLCIARVMLMNPNILIFDEATSNIDTSTEQKIQLSLQSIIKNKTSFIVAHRLSTIKNADLIIVLDHGNIIESGKHEELLAKKGHYFDIYNAQFIQKTN